MSQTRLHPWWFIDDRAAGMARPGFNGCPWFELGLEEGVLQTWIGERSALDPPIFDDGLGPYLDGRVYCDGITLGSAGADRADSSQAPAERAWTQRPSR